MQQNNNSKSEEVHPGRPKLKIQQLVCSGSKYVTNVQEGISQLTLKLTANGHRKLWTEENNTPSTPLRLFPCGG